MDNVSREVRSKIMAAIKQTGNKSTEWRVRATLIGKGICGWKLGTASNLPGRPEFVFESRKVVVFIDGCFWHGCPYCYRPPKTHRRFWAEKIAKNQARDVRVAARLRREGWAVVRLRECRLEEGLRRLLTIAGKAAISVRMGSRGR